MSMGDADAVGQDASRVEVEKFKQEESFDMSMVDADATGQDTTDVQIERVREDTFDKSMMDVEASTLDADGDKVGEASAASLTDGQAHAPVPYGFKNEEVVAPSPIKIQPPPSTPVTKRKRKSSEVGDIGG